MNIITGLNTLICKLDERRKKKLGNALTRCVPRAQGSALDVAPPKKLPNWMVIEDFQVQANPSSQPPQTPSSSTVRGTFPNTQSTPISSSSPSNSNSYDERMYSFETPLECENSWSVSPY